MQITASGGFSDIVANLSYVAAATKGISLTVIKETHGKTMYDSSLHLKNAKS